VIKDVSRIRRLREAKECGIINTIKGFKERKATADGNRDRNVTASMNQTGKEGLGADMARGG